MEQTQETIREEAWNTQDTQAASAQDELTWQYNLISESEEYLGLVVAATLLSYYTIDSQRQQLGAALNGQEPQESGYFILQMSAALMILYAVSYFYGISIKVLEEHPPEDPALLASAQINSLINELILLAAGLRIYGLLLSESAAETDGAEAADLEAEEPLPI